jgi:hypothetical protein
MSDDATAWIANRAGDLDSPEQAALAEVTGCGDCLCAVVDYDTEWFCEHPGAPRRLQVSSDGIRGANYDGSPDWCPLRARPLLVRLRR